MKNKKKVSSIAILIMLIVAAMAVIVVISNKETEQQIPYIAFVENSTREDCLFICANGDIFAATSEEAFIMDFSELAEKIQEDNYADILEFMGTTDAGKVKKMYRLYSSVVLKDGYYVTSRKEEGPALQVYGGKEYGGKVRYWSGIYYDDEGELMSRGIYQSNSDMICSDIRAYVIVEWMYECLKDYME